MPLLKILNVSVPPLMAVVPRSSVFALQTRRYKMYRKYILYRACECFLYAPSTFRTAKDGSGFIQQRDLGYAQISSLKSVQGRTLFNSLFQKAYGGRQKNKANALIDPDVFYKCGKVLLRFVYLLNCCGYIGL